MTAWMAISGQLARGDQTPSTFGCAEAFPALTVAAASAPSRKRKRARTKDVPMQVGRVAVTRRDLVLLKRSVAGRIYAADVSPRAERRGNSLGRYSVPAVGAASFSC